MALNIKSDECDRLARELASLTGESITDAVTRSLRDRLAEERRRRDDTAERERLRADLRRIREEASKWPVLDPRSDNEILGYNEYGTFD